MPYETRSNVQLAGGATIDQPLGHRLRRRYAVVIYRQPNHAADRVIQGDGHGIGFSGNALRNRSAARRPARRGNRPPQPAADRPSRLRMLNSRGLLGGKHAGARVEHDFAIGGDSGQFRLVADAGGLGDFQAVGGAGRRRETEQPPCPRRRFARQRADRRRPRSPGRSATSVPERSTGLPWGFRATK